MNAITAMKVRAHFATRKGFEWIDIEWREMDPTESREAFVERVKMQLRDAIEAIQDF